MNGEFEEKHMKQPDPSRYKHIFSDGKIHLMRLMTYKWAKRFVIELDNYVIAQGSLLKDFEPSVNPPEYVDDPNDAKPSDWDDRPQIVDPDDTKPDDWDESQPEYIEEPGAVIPEDWYEHESKYIDDSSAEKPIEWDETIDGEWVPPKIPNPLCVNNNCGVWSPPLIKNPKYKGIFKPKMIANPNYKVRSLFNKGYFKPRKIKNPNFFLDENPFKMTPIDAVAIEVVASPNVVTFDNIIITNKADALMVFNKKHWKSKNSFDAKAVLNKYKFPIIIGSLVIGSLAFAIVLIFKYSLPMNSASEPALPEEESNAHEQTKTDPVIDSDESIEETTQHDDENDEKSEEEPPIVLRRSARKSKKNFN